MAILNPKQYIAQLKAQMNEIRKNQRPLFISASKVHAVMVNRIFVRGKDSTGSQIGEYSNVYAAARKKKGRQTSFVDLKFTGRLNVDFANSLTRKNNTFVAGTKSKENSEKIDDIVKRYGEDIFRLSQTEKKLYVKTQHEQFLKIVG